MFFRTVMCGQRAYDWKTMPMFRLFGGTLTRRPASKTGRSANEIAPSSAVSSPAMQRSVVVFPQPLGPSRTRNSPSSISRSRSSIAVVGALPPKRFVRLRIRTLDIWPPRALIELTSGSETPLFRIPRRGARGSNRVQVQAGFPGRLRGGGELGERCLGQVRVAAEDRQLPADEEPADLAELQGAARPVPVPDAVVEAEHRPRQEARVVLGQEALLHAAREERPPRELEVARLRAGARARGLLARQRPGRRDPAELGDHDALPHDLLVGDVE